MIEMEEVYKFWFTWLWRLFWYFSGIHVIYIAGHYSEDGDVIFNILAILSIWFITSFFLKIERKRILFIASILSFVLLSLSIIFPSFRGFIAELPGIFDYFYRYK